MSKSPTEQNHCPTGTLQTYKSQIHRSVVALKSKSLQVNTEMKCPRTSNKNKSTLLDVTAGKAAVVVW